MKIHIIDGPHKGESWEGNIPLPVIELAKIEPLSAVFRPDDPDADPLHARVETVLYHLHRYRYRGGDLLVYAQTAEPPSYGDARRMLRVVRERAPWEGREES